MYIWSDKEDSSAKYLRHRSSLITSIRKRYGSFPGIRVTHSQLAGMGVNVSFSDAIISGFVVI